MKPTLLLQRKATQCNSGRLQLQQYREHLIRKLHCEDIHDLVLDFLSNARGLHFARYTLRFVFPAASSCQHAPYVLTIMSPLPHYEGCSIGDYLRRLPKAMATL
jgi:hypothetical protein